MPTGDPMWKCSHCGAVHYEANRKFGCCDCPASQPKQSYNTSFATVSTTDTLAKKFESMFSEGTNTDVAIHDNSDVLTERHHPETLVVNMFAGPGSGKSTTAAGLFFELKSRGINCELASEFAKDLAWEERHKTFEDQIYIFGKQYHRIHRLMGQVSVVITDSPLLLTPVYDSEKRKTLEQLAVEEHNKMWTYNVFLKRVKPFNPKGRVHGEDHAKEKDGEIIDILYKHDVAFEVFDGSPEGKDAIVKKVLMLLSWGEGKSFLGS